MNRKILHEIIEYNSLLGRMEIFYILYAVDLLTKFLANRAGDEHIAGGLEFFSLDKTVRECAEKIAKYKLYENANELLHSDPTTAYIIRAEAGSSDLPPDFAQREC